MNKGDSNSKNIGSGGGSGACTSNWVLLSEEGDPRVYGNTNNSMSDSIIKEYHSEPINTQSNSRTSTTNSTVFSNISTSQPTPNTLLDYQPINNYIHKSNSSVQLHSDYSSQIPSSPPPTTSPSHFQQQQPSTSTTISGSMKFITIDNRSSKVIYVIVSPTPITIPPLQNAPTSSSQGSNLKSSGKFTQETLFSPPSVSSSASSSRSLLALKEIIPTLHNRKINISNMLETFSNISSPPTTPNTKVYVSIFCSQINSNSHNSSTVGYSVLVASKQYEYNTTISVKDSVQSVKNISDQEFNILFHQSSNSSISSSLQSQIDSSSNGISSPLFNRSLDKIPQHSSSTMLNSSRPCDHSDIIVNGAMLAYEHEITELSLDREFLQQYKLQNSIISIYPETQDQLTKNIENYSEYEGIMTEYNSILTQLSVELSNTNITTSSNNNNNNNNNNNSNSIIKYLLNDIVSLLDRILIFNRELDSSLFNRIGNNIKIMFDHLNIIKKDLIQCDGNMSNMTNENTSESQNSNNSNNQNNIAFNGLFVCYNHFILYNDRPSKQVIFRFLYSIVPMSYQPNLITDSFRNYLTLSKSNPIPFGVEWKLTLKTSHFTPIIRYNDILLKNISLCIDHPTFPSQQVYRLSQPIIINDDNHFIQSVYNFFQDLYSLSLRDDRYYLEYLIGNIKFIYSIIPKKNRNLTSIEIEKLMIFIKKNSIFLKEVIPKFIKNLYFDPYFYYFWNNDLLHLLINNKEGTNSNHELLLLLNNNESSFLISFDERSFYIHYNSKPISSPKINSSSNNLNNNNNSNSLQFNIKSENFETLQTLINFINSKDFQTVILSTSISKDLNTMTVQSLKEMLQRFSLVGGANQNLNSSMSSLPSLSTSLTASVFGSSSSNIKPPYATPTSQATKLLCGSCLSRFKLILEEFDQEETNESIIYKDYIESYEQHRQDIQNASTGYQQDLQDEILEMDKELQDLEQEELQLIQEYIQIEKQLKENFNTREELEKIYNGIKEEERLHYDNVNVYYQRYFALQTEKDQWDSYWQSVQSEFDRVSKIDIYRTTFDITFERFGASDQYIGCINDLKLGILSNSNTPSTSSSIMTTSTSVSNNNNISASTTENKIDWEELNNALGETVLLLYFLAKHLDFEFSYKLIPMGNKSLIELVNSSDAMSGSISGSTANPSNKTTYPLYGSEAVRFSASFLWFTTSSDSKFDNGMEALLTCVNELCVETQLHFGYIIQKDKIGDANRMCSIRTAGNSEHNWSNALKFMLENLKRILDNLQNLRNNNNNKRKK
ncbi:autophagy protein 6 [Tieghemostelium lacteum]|uniref:Autophagy protein 6 n=1 Tax=Tieghemostelium lacteum TaxID=361077 RepID=A0A151ZS78_TIELA|nr:autophagy protein 6 [Tieghemostelium lacteum]|eukprot:KYQ96780.1 autophagy protein 6 [Tieghemostelium lacteum]